MRTCRGLVVGGWDCEGILSIHRLIATGDGATRRPRWCVRAHMSKSSSSQSLPGAFSGTPGSAGRMGCVGEGRLGAGGLRALGGRVSGETGRLEVLASGCTAWAGRGNWLASVVAL